MRQNKDAVSAISWKPAALLLAALSLGYSLAAYWLYSHETAYIRAAKFEELKNISTLKLTALNDWREERLADANLNSSGILNLRITEFLKTGDPAVKKEILERLQLLCRYENYQNAILAAANGRVFFAVDNHAAGLGPETLALAALALSSQKPVFGDLFRCSSCGQVHLDIAAPILDGKGRPLAALILRTDPRTFLHPLLHSWPTPAKTAETLLVRKDAGSLLYLHELRHSSGTALSLRIPLTRTEVPGVQAALGGTGGFEGRDYRGIKVLADLRPVPDWPWFMVNKVDADEILAEAHYRGVMIFIVAGLLTLLTVGALFIFFRRRHARLSAALLDAEGTAQQQGGTIEAIYESLGSPAFSLDREYRYTSFNSAHAGVMKALYGAELRLGTSLLKYQTVAADRDAARKNLDLALRGERSTETAVSGQGPARRFFEVEHNPVRNARGEVIGVSVFARDVTERRLAADALRDSEDKFKYIFDNSTIGKSLTLPSGEINVNKAFCDLLGYSPQELMSKKWQELTPAEDIEATQGFLNAVISGEKTAVRFNKRYLHKNGSIVWADVSTALRRDKHGKPLYFMTSLVDITDRKRGEEDIRRLNSELEQRVALRTVQLENVNKELEAFCYSVSHDLRAPLRSIDGFSLALLEDYENTLDTEGQEHLQRIRTSAQRMGVLIDDLLKLSRISRSELTHERLDLSALALAVIKDLQKAQPERVVECVIQRGVSVDGDAHLLRIALDNLLGNAWKFTGKQPKARIEFGAVSSGSGTTFFVRDNGAGFDMKYGGKLFSAFQRLHKTEDFPGTGIGLVTVQRIVARHGGRVWAEAGMGKGATFYFTLGIHKETQHD